MPDNPSETRDVERVARAMCIAEGRDPDRVSPFIKVPKGQVPDLRHDRLWKNYETAARAAISAMATHEVHTPVTEEMIERAYNATTGRTLQYLNDELTFAEMCKIIKALAMRSVSASKGDELVIAHLKRAAEDAKELGSGKDFNQGVVRGLEIAVAQIENGHHRTALSNHRDR